LSRYPLIAFKLKNATGFVGMGLDFRSNVLGLGPEVFKHFLATALLRIGGIQNLEPRHRRCSIWPEAMLSDRALQVFAVILLLALAQSRRIETQHRARIAEDGLGENGRSGRAVARFCKHWKSRG
jgi:hypothetical protein